MCMIDMAVLYDKLHSSQHELGRNITIDVTFPLQLYYSSSFRILDD